MSVSLLPLPVGVLDLLATGDHAAAGRALGRAVPPGFLDCQWVWAHFAALIRAEPELAWWRTQYAVVEDDRIVGHVRLHSHEGTRECQVGWEVEPIHRHRGVGRQAAAAIVGVAATRPEIDRVVALVAHDNAASIAVAEATGFVADGEQRHRFGWLMRRFVRTLRD